MWPSTSCRSSTSATSPARPCTAERTSWSRDSTSMSVVVVPQAPPVRTARRTRSPIDYHSRVRVDHTELRSAAPDAGGGSPNDYRRNGRAASSNSRPPAARDARGGTKSPAAGHLAPTAVTIASQSLDPSGLRKSVVRRDARGGLGAVAAGAARLARRAGPRPARRGAARGALNAADVGAGANVVEALVAATIGLLFARSLNAPAIAVAVPVFVALVDVWSVAAAPPRSSSRAAPPARPAVVRPSRLGLDGQRRAPRPQRRRLPRDVRRVGDAPRLPAGGRRSPPSR